MGSDLIALCCVISLILSSASAQPPSSLPLLLQIPGIKLPALSCSQDTPSNASVAAVVNAKNGQLFTAGQNAYYISFDWNALETAGSPNISFLMQVTDILNSVGQSIPLAAYYLIKTIDTNLLQLPADLVSANNQLAAGLLWNSSAIVSRFSALLGAVLPYLQSTGQRVFSLSLGNEVDVWLSLNSQVLRDSYVDFVQQMIALCHTQYPQLAVSVTVTYSGAKNRHTVGFEWLDRLMSLGDLTIYTYYPLAANFSVLPPSVAGADLSAMLSLSDAGKQIMVQEVGYPTGYEPPTDGSSPAMQAQFITDFYNAVIPVQNRFALINYFLLDDAPGNNPYGINITAFNEYLDTLGILYVNGSSKPGFDSLLAAYATLRSSPLPTTTPPPSSSSTPQPTSPQPSPSTAPPSSSPSTSPSPSSTATGSRMTTTGSQTTASVTPSPSATSATSSTTGSNSGSSLPIPIWAIVLIGVGVLAIIGVVIGLVLWRRHVKEQSTHYRLHL